MAFILKQFSPNGAQAKSGNAPSTWTHSGTDAKSAVATSGYFNEVASLLTVGDLIYYYKTDSTVSASMHVVLTNASGVVDVSAGTDISVA